jgi:Rps23 Pro-64 3,4-dihydroxylase Tpa1-like proline 4-hydroxylase
MNDVFSDPPPCGLIANWLGRDMSRLVFDYAQKQHHSFRRDQKRIDRAVTRLTKLKELGDLKNELVARAQASLPTMIQQMRFLPFEPSRFEFEMVAHGDGAFSKRRRYNFIANDPELRRRIGAVYYFHRTPKVFSGGTLRVHSFTGTNGVFVDMEPTNDTLVFFPTSFPHEVLPVTCPSDRFEDLHFAINWWVHC